jgi:hypothetical protein
VSRKGFTANHHLQFWDKKDCAPSKRDALITLTQALGLLSEALPIALRNIGTMPIETQENFWRALLAFDREVDLSLREVEGPSDEREDIYGQALEDLRSIVEARVSQPSGSLDDEENTSS